MPVIDPQRFLDDLHTLRKIGAYKTGVHRPTYSPEDMQARHWVMERMTEAGLIPTIDGIGNILGRHPGAGAKVLVGSHLESQNHAGWLDGALGVMAGVALARAGLPVDAVVFADEEGHYASFPGSRSFVGLLSDAEIDASTNRYHATPLRTALAEAGLAGKPRLRIEPARYRAFFEMHIEQGIELDKRGFAAAPVTGIVAIWQWKLVFTGQQNHAGSTMMSDRRDAGLAAVRLLARIDREFPALAGPRTVWTTGRIALEPGAPSIIPGRAEVLFQFRDIDMDVLYRLEAALRRYVDDANAEGPCGVTLAALGKSTPALCDETLLAALDAASEKHAPGRWLRLPSGAGHDAQYIAPLVPSAMLFVPSINGVSHHWDENTRDEDLATGIRILADAAAGVLAQ